MSVSEVPVFLFTGFLDAGKTTFLQNVLENPEFNDGTKTLLIVCEEGEEEYDVSKYPSKHVSFLNIESEDDFDARALEKARKKEQAARVMVEYNGMWQLASFLRELPSNWIIAQELTFAEAPTYSAYNANMRNMVGDKLRNADAITFTKVTAETDREELHKIVRSMNRNVEIVYDLGNGVKEPDDIEDPLPFDINAPVIEIGDRDYGLWYADLVENLSKYDGKKVRFKAFIGKEKSLGHDEFFAGRHVMTCCANDIQFAGMLCYWNDAYKLSNGDWAMIEADIKIEKNRVYRSKGPVLRVKSLSKTNVPEETVVTLY